MIVRSATLGIDWQSHSKDQLESDILEFFATSTRLFANHGLEFRTHRLLLPAFSIKESVDNETINFVVSWISKFCEKNGIRWFCVPFRTFGQQMREVNSVAIEIAKRHKNAFLAKAAK